MRSGIWRGSLARFVRATMGSKEGGARKSRNRQSNKQHTKTRSRLFVCLGEPARVYGGMRRAAVGRPATGAYVGEVQQGSERGRATRRARRREKNRKTMLGGRYCRSSSEVRGGNDMRSHIEVDLGGRLVTAAALFNCHPSLPNHSPTRQSHLWLTVLFDADHFPHTRPR